MGEGTGAKFAVGVVLFVVFLSIAITAWVGQAPTINNATSTAAGSPLALSGAGAGTNAGLVYGLVPLLWAIGLAGIAFLGAKKFGLV